MNQYEVKFVDAIEEGKIVKVPEDYALREGLPILRKPKIVSLEHSKKEEVKRTGFERKEKEAYNLDRFRKPLRQKNDVVASLRDNFQWQVSAKRRQLNLSRKQVAAAIGVKENDVKMIENGLLPQDDYVLVNKIQNYFGINLRKDGKDFTTPMREVVEKAALKEVNELEGMQPKKENFKDEGKIEADELILGSDIEIVDDK